MKQHLLSLLCLLLLPLSAFGQGALNPPGGPEPTMKTLEQVEPRTPVDASTAPGDEQAEHVISQPGSYYLTANLRAARPNAIRVTAAGVTLDLNGFRITRGSGTGGTGVSSSAADFVLKNGSVSGFAQGISSSGAGGAFLHLNVSECSSGGLFAGSGARVENCSARAIAGSGINVGDGSTVENCTVSAGTGLADAALRAGDGSTLINCSARGNSADAGIKAGNGATLINCAARSNTGSKGVSAGISAGVHSTLIGCAASFNTSTSATPTASTGAGITVAEGTLVKGCTAGLNRGDGIYVENACIVIDCVASGNGFQTGVGAGIRSGANNSRIQNNNVTSNDVGIRVEGTGNVVEGNHVRNHPGPGIQVTTVNGKNVIIRNIAGDNVNSYTSIASGNDVGPIGSAASATSPFANLQN